MGNKKKRASEPFKVLNVHQIVAKARSEAKGKPALMEHRAMKSHMMMLYVPEKGSNFKDMTLCMVYFDEEGKRVVSDKTGKYNTLMRDRPHRPACPC